SFSSPHTGQFMTSALGEESSTSLAQANLEISMLSRRRSQFFAGASLFKISENASGVPLEIFLIEFLAFHGRVGGCWRKPRSAELCHDYGYVVSAALGVGFIDQRLALVGQGFSPLHTRNDVGCGDHVVQAIAAKQDAVALTDFGIRHLDIHALAAPLRLCQNAPPAVLFRVVGHFDTDFLEIVQECLIASQLGQLAIANEVGTGIPNLRHKKI